jgi:predicted ArsR family transcriptional regulator
VKRDILKSILSREDASRFLDILNDVCINHNTLRYHLEDLVFRKILETSRLDDYRAAPLYYHIASNDEAQEFIKEMI